MNVCPASSGAPARPVQPWFSLGGPSDADAGENSDAERELPPPSCTDAPNPWWTSRSCPDHLRRACCHPAVYNVMWRRGKTRAESLIHPIQRASYQHTRKTQTNSNYDNQIEQNTTGLFVLNTTGVRVMLHEESWQDVTFELALGLDLSWLWSSSDSGRGLGFLSSDSRRWASDGKRERNDFSSMSSSVIESSNFTE